MDAQLSGAVPRLTPRDFDLLRFVGEQHAVTLAQLARRLRAHKPWACRITQRWRRGGYVEMGELVASAPHPIWLTRAGMRVAGLPFAAGAPDPGAIRHIARVVDTRIWVERRRPDAVWISERELALDGKPSGVHRPDALVMDEGQTVAVEVELTLKARGRLEAIVASHLERYPAVWYFAAPGPARVLAEIAAVVGPDRLQVLPLP